MGGGVTRGDWWDTTAPFCDCLILARGGLSVRTSLRDRDIREKNVGKLSREIAGPRDGWFGK